MADNSGDSNDSPTDRFARVQTAWTAFSSIQTESTFAAFYHSTKGFAHSIARRILVEEEDVRDAVQHVYAELLEIARDSARSALISDADDLVRRITLQVSDRIRYRRNVAKRRFGSQIALESIGDDREATVVRYAIDRELQEYVRTALSMMPERYRRPIELAYFEGLTRTELAAALGVERSKATRILEDALHRFSLSISRTGISKNDLPLILAAVATGAMLRGPTLMASADVLQSSDLTPGRLRTAPANRSVNSPALTAGRHERFRSGLSRSSKTPEIAVCVASFVLLLLLFLRYQWVSSPPTASAFAATSGPKKGSAPGLAKPVVAARLKTGEIVGRVLRRRSAEPVENIDIEIRSEREPPTILQTVSSDAAGYFRARDLAFGHYRIQVLNPPAGLAAPPARTVALSRLSDSRDVGDILLSGMAMIRGRVLELDEQSHILYTVPNHPVTFKDSPPLREVHQLTDEDGSFRFEHLNQRYNALVLPGRLGKPHHDVILDDGEIRDIDLFLTPRRVEGTITRAGKPEYGAIVEARLEAGDEALVLRVSTNPAGKYAFQDMPASRWRLEAVAREAAQRLQKAVRFIEVPQETTAIVHADMQLPSAVLAIEITDADGTPLHAETLIRITSICTNADPDAVSAVDIQTTAVTGERFSVVDGLPPGEYQVAAVSTEAPAGSACTRITIPEEGVTTATLRLMPSESLAGIEIDVRDRYSDLAITPQCWFDLLRREDLVSTESEIVRVRWPVVSISPIHVQLFGVPAGRYDLVCGAFGYASNVHSVELNASAKIRIGLSLEEAGALQWTILGIEGNPASNAACHLYDASNEESSLENSKPLRSGLATSNGMWVVRGLQPGAYWLKAEFKGLILQEHVRVYAHDLAIKRSRFIP